MPVFVAGFMLLSKALSIEMLYLHTKKTRNVPYHHI